MVCGPAWTSRVRPDMAAACYSLLDRFFGRAEAFRAMQRSVVSRCERYARDLVSRVRRLASRMLSVEHGSALCSRDALPGQHDLQNTGGEERVWCGCRLGSWAARSSCIPFPCTAHAS